MIKFFVCSVWKQSTPWLILHACAKEQLKSFPFSPFSLGGFWGLCIYGYQSSILFLFLKIVQMHPLHGEIFEGKKSKKKLKRELRWEISNCGFAICSFQIQLFFFLMPWIFFLLLHLAQVRSPRPPHNSSILACKGDWNEADKSLLKTIRCNKYYSNLKTSGLNWWFHMTWQTVAWAKGNSNMGNAKG
jgi:hypothetical protein